MDTMDRKKNSAASRARRSLLFTPANRPEMFARALSSNADMVCIDLEDSVAPNEKSAARDVALKFMASEWGTGQERVIRINSPRTRAGLDDVVAILNANLASGIILIPKVETADELKWIGSLLEEADSGLELAALIESPIGFERSFDILNSVADLEFTMFGGADLAAELGTDIATAPLAYGRARLLYASKSAGIDVLDMPCLDFRSEDTLNREAKDAKTLGFTGKAVIHPSNIKKINDTFTPTLVEVDHAKKAIEAFYGHSAGVAIVDGRIVERPVIRRLERILRRSLYMDV